MYVVVLHLFTFRRRKSSQEFRVRRDLIVEGLNAIQGIRCLVPDGAFYVFPNVGGTGHTGEELAHTLLYDGGEGAVITGDVVSTTLSVRRYCDISPAESPAALMPPW